MNSRLMIANGIILIVMSFFSRNLSTFLEIGKEETELNIIQPMIENIFPMISNLMVFIGIIMLILGIFYLFINNENDYTNSYVSNDSKSTIKNTITTKKNNFFYDEEENGFFQILHNLMTTNNQQKIKTIDKD